jgi:oxygen-independent coproporphyrinogen-3 oxidase
VHDDSEARRAAEQARHAGFDNVNLDLMFGLPGQSIQQALADLDTALACEPSHLSWYQLTIEPNTVFYSHPPVLPEDDLLSEMQDAGIDLLANHGFARYEVSAYAQQGRQSHHNLNYWQFGDYLGIGAGAHGKLTLANEQHILRTRKIRQPVGYLGASAGFTAESLVVPDSDLPLEFLMNALRLCDGVDEVLFAARTGQTIDKLQPALDVLRSKDLIQADRLATTEKGFRFLNDVLAEFVPAEDHKPGKISVKSLS